MDDDSLNIIIYIYKKFVLLWVIVLTSGEGEAGYGCGLRAGRVRPLLLEGTVTLNINSSEDMVNQTALHSAPLQHQSHFTEISQ